MDERVQEVSEIRRSRRILPPLRQTEHFHVHDAPDEEEDQPECKDVSNDGQGSDGCLEELVEGVESEE